MEEEKIPFIRVGFVVAIMISPSLYMQAHIEEKLYIALLA